MTIKHPADVLPPAACLRSTTAQPGSAFTLYTHKATRTRVLPEYFYLNQRRQRHDNRCTPRAYSPMPPRVCRLGYAASGVPPRVYRVSWHPMQAAASCAESSRWARSTSMLKVPPPLAAPLPPQGSLALPGRGQAGPLGAKPLPRTSMLRVPPWQCSSAFVPPRGAPGGSGQLGCSS